MLITIYVSG